MPNVPMIQLPLESSTQEPCLAVRRQLLRDRVAYLQGLLVVIAFNAVGPTGDVSFVHKPRVRSLANDLSPATTTSQSAGENRIECDYYKLGLHKCVCEFVGTKIISQ